TSLQKQVIRCLHLMSMKAVSFYFFFQAEDGIRDRNVTGVQTCALPIFLFGIASNIPTHSSTGAPLCCWLYRRGGVESSRRAQTRSEERRVGKECGSRYKRDHNKGSEN